MADTHSASHLFGAPVGGAQTFETAPAQPRRAWDLPDYPRCEHDPYPVQLIGTISGHVVLWGFAVVETGGVAAARVDLFDGADTTGLLALPLSLAPSESTSDGPWARGIHFRNGLVARLTSGAATGSLLVCLRRHEYHA